MDIEELEREEETEEGIMVEICGVEEEAAEHLETVLGMEVDGEIEGTGALE